MECCYVIELPEKNILDIFTTLTLSDNRKFFNPKEVDF